MRWDASAMKCTFPGLALRVSLLLAAGCSGAARIAPAPLIPESRVPAPRAEIAMAAPAPSSVPSPTWSQIYAAYFAPRTTGGCGRSRTCHADTMADASTAYGWLTQRGYIDGTRSALVSKTNSCLRWFGGNMPPRGNPDGDATRDLEAWVAAGAPED
jgi:hypothetical protein